MFLRSWTLCNKLNHNDLDIRPKNLTIWQDLTKNSDYEEEYCKKGHVRAMNSQCNENGNVIECSSELFDGHALSCQLSLSGKVNMYEYVVFTFPKDQVKQADVIDFSQDFYFFQDLMLNEERNKNKGSLTIRVVSFDIADLETNTNENLTKEVAIWADVVTISRPITINYRLKIIARKVMIDEKISMKLPIEKVKNQTYVTKFEKHFGFKETNVRHRKYGLIEIIDEAPPNVVNNVTGCQPMKVLATAENIPESWYDETFAGMIYLYASSLLETNGPGQKALAVQISNFHSDLYHDYSIVRNSRAFFAAHRLSRVQLVAQQDGVVHTVPVYRLDSITDLASTMHGKLTQYKTTERKQEEELSTLQSRFQDMQVHFANIDLQFQNFMAMEMDQLETFFAQNAASATFNSQHRTAATNKLSSEIDLNKNSTITMAGIQMDVFNAEAANSVEHYKNVIAKFEKEIESHQAKADKQAETIRINNDNFDQAMDKLDEESDKYKKNLEKYKASERKKAFWGMLKCIVAVGTAVAATVVTAGAAAPTAIATAGAVAAKTTATTVLGAIEVVDAIDTITSVIDEFEKFGEIYSHIRGVHKQVGPESNKEDLDALIEEPSPNFLEVLKLSTKLERAGSWFDGLERKAEKLEKQNLETENKIAGIDDFRSAYVTLANEGNRLIASVGEYSDTTLTLVTKKGDFRVANSDLERATAQVKTIASSKEEIKKRSDTFNGQILVIKNDYEKESNTLLGDYKKAAEEKQQEIKAKIYQRYENLKDTFSSNKANYFDSLNLMADALEEKRIGLKLASMNHRSMMLNLFDGYCQALFYNSFKECNKNDKPLLTDNMDDLLQKLFDLSWDSIMAPLQGLFLLIRKVVFQEPMHVLFQGALKLSTMLVLMLS